MHQCNLSTEKLYFITYKGILPYNVDIVYHHMGLLNDQEEDARTGRTLPPNGQAAPSFSSLSLRGITYANAKLKGHKFVCSEY